MIQRVLAKAMHVQVMRSLLLLPISAVVIAASRSVSCAAARLLRCASASARASGGTRSATRWWSTRLCAYFSSRRRSCAVSASPCSSDGTRARREKAPLGQGSRTTHRSRCRRLRRAGAAPLVTARWQPTGHEERAARGRKTPHSSAPPGRARALPHAAYLAEAAAPVCVCFTCLRAFSAPLAGGGGHT